MIIPPYFQAAKQQLRPGNGEIAPELGLIIVVIAVVGMMIIPLPLILIDLLVGINMSFSVLILLSVLYIRTPLEFTSFPSVLLITTLFRLSLSIATTRLILSEGEAGDIITTFGTLVAGGNLVVGLVVYLIIVVVQFIVIAKGAERVAEVGARFTLDAMPGKQLSIDSDLRSGLMDKDEARRRRQDLELESKMYGSLDGAMKFVKGDAIASILIVITNLIAGIVIGTAQRGLPLGEAARLYSLLSIGDGLVSQIPALLSAMAAGLLVTRGSAEAEDRNFGSSVARQLIANPRALLFAGAVTALMAAVPGFPWIVFLLIAAGLALGGAWLLPDLRPKVHSLFATLSLAAHRPGGIKPQPGPRALSVVPTSLPPVLPLLVELKLAATDQVLGADFQSEIGRQLETLQYELGINLPRIAVHFDETEGDRRWRLLAYELPIAADSIDQPAADEGQQIAAAVAGRICRALRRDIGLFVGIQETTDLLNQAGTDYPEVVKEAVRQIPITAIAEVLRNLLVEGVSIRRFRDVLEAIAEAAARETDSGRLSDLVRIALKRSLLAQHAPQGALDVLVMSPSLEALLLDARSGDDAEARGAIVLGPDQIRAVLDTIASQARSTGATALLASFELRRALRSLIAPDMPDLPVLSYNELSPTLKLQVLGHIHPPLPAPPPGIAGPVQLEPSDPSL